MSAPACAGALVGLRDLAARRSPESSQSAPTANMRGMWEKHGTAIITGATAIIAAACASWFTSSSTRDVVREESRRVAEIRDETAQGAARILIGEFLVVGEELGDWVWTGAMVPFGPDFPIAMRQEDLALIAARVNPRQWNAISRGLSTVQQLRRYVHDRTRERNRFTGKLISRRIVHTVADDLEAVRRAALALSAVARVGAEVPGVTIEPDVVFRQIQRKSRTYGIPIAAD
jgi:hypothetical protein